MAHAQVSLTAPRTEQADQVTMSRIWWVGLLALVASIAATALIRAIAVPLFAIPPHFVSLQWARPLGFTALGVLGAVIVFALVCQWARRPLWLYRRIALAPCCSCLSPTACSCFIVLSRMRRRSRSACWPLCTSRPTSSPLACSRH